MESENQALSCWGCWRLTAVRAQDGGEGNPRADCLVGLSASSKRLSLQGGGGLRTAALLLCKQVGDTLL